MNRRGSFRLEINEDSTIFIDKREIMELTRIAKSWEFTCTFCFRRFASAQALGGHQNAHRNERKEEKRLFIRDPIGYRKRVFLRALKLELAGLNAAPKIAKKCSRSKAKLCAAFGMFSAVFANGAVSGCKRKTAQSAAHANGVKLDLELKL